ncbi:type II toxin-antitoxin system VapC family toxin [Streptomyces sp. NPDC001930]|uniref:type II toxin-antitoxin system VapC family toxin n=1 Tax=Streptomyces sp. NPDC001930 TaxID=3364625 RepID=UPI0036B4A4CB
MNTPPRLAVADACILIAAFNRRDTDYAQANATLNQVGTIVVTPLVLAEVDHALHKKVGEREAVSTLAHVRTLAEDGALLIPPISPADLKEAVSLLDTYLGSALGITDAVNAVLAWRTCRPAVLSFDYHYREVLVPRRHGEKPLEVWPDIYGQYGSAAA